MAKRQHWTTEEVLEEILSGEEPLEMTAVEREDIDNGTGEIDKDEPIMELEGRIRYTTHKYQKTLDKAKIHNIDGDLVDSWSVADPPEPVGQGMPSTQESSPPSVGLFFSS